MTFKKLCSILVVTGMVILFSSCAAGTTTSKKSNQSGNDISTSSVASKSKLFSGVDSSSLDNAKIYTDGHFNFSVGYPADWKVDIEKYCEATTSEEGSPDGGIDIYVEGSKSDTIRIFGQYGTVGTGIIDFTWTADTTENFVTSDGLVGHIYYNDDSGIKQAVLLLDDQHAVQLKVSDATFNRDKQQIYAILKSIKITKS
jgi:hypothetical protein